MQETSLQYRLATQNDVPALCRLWEQETPWGALSPETWQEWYVNTPFGACTIAMIVDTRDDSAAGMVVFTPSRVELPGQSDSVFAVRLSAPILRRDLRQRSLRHMGHPVIALYRAGMADVVQRGGRLVYAFPDPAWLPFFRWLPRFATAELACRRIPLAAARKADRGAVARPVVDWEPVAALCRESRPDFAPWCRVERSAAWLAFRNQNHAARVVFGTNSDLLGFVAVRRGGDLVMDTMARSSSELATVLGAGLVSLSDAGELSGDSAKVLETGWLSEPLDQLAAVPDEYRFAFACDPLCPEMTAEQIAPERWFLMPAD